MDWNHDHLYSWRAQQSRLKRDRLFECIAIAGAVGGTIGMTVLFFYMLSA